MNVGELKAMLDDYGDWLEVVVDDTYDVFDINDVSDMIRGGEAFVVIEQGIKKVT